MKSVMNKGQWEEEEKEWKKKKEVSGLRKENDKVLEKQTVMLQSGHWGWVSSVWYEVVKDSGCVCVGREFKVVCFQQKGTCVLVVVVMCS